MTQNYFEETTNRLLAENNRLRQINAELLVELKSLCGCVRTEVSQSSTNETSEHPILNDHAKRLKKACAAIARAEGKS